MKKIFSIMLMAITMTINIIFWVTMLALIAWGLVFLTGAIHTLTNAPALPALSFWQSVELLVFLCCLLITPLREGWSIEGEDRRSNER